MELAQASMSSQPTISVCIANYNGIGLIDGCIASVLVQDCGVAVEIIVHDDASIDGSVQHIRNRYPEVRLLQSAENVGFCVANNRMADVASGEYLLLLNNDAELYPDALATLYKAAQHIGHPAIFGLPQYDFDTGELLDIGCLVDPFLNPVPNKNSERGEVAMVMGACLWIPKDLWQELEGFPAWFDSIAEDLYLCCRARLAGYSVRALGISGYRHRVGGSFGGGKVRQGRLATTLRRRVLSERNKSFVIVLTYPAPVFQCLFPLHLLLLLIEGGVLAMLKGNYSLFRDIYFASLKGLWSEKERLGQLRSKLQSDPHMCRWRFFSVFSFLPYKLRLLLKHGIPQIQ